LRDRKSQAGALRCPSFFQAGGAARNYLEIALTEVKENDRALIRRFRDSDQKEPLLLRSIPLSRSLQSAAISVDVKAKRLRMRFQPGDEFLQGRGVIQGGILATMLDFTIAFAAMTVTAEDKAVATASLNVSYLKPAAPGVYFCDAEVERAGRTLVFVRASLFPENGDPVATATAVMSVINTA
jgi:uncharacterized protein (TIGR00369 family)